MLKLLSNLFLQIFNLFHRFQLKFCRFTQLLNELFILIMRHLERTLYYLFGSCGVHLPVRQITAVVEFEFILNPIEFLHNIPCVRLGTTAGIGIHTPDVLLRLLVEHLEDTEDNKRHLIRQPCFTRLHHQTNALDPELSIQEKITKSLCPLRISTM